MHRSNCRLKGCEQNRQRHPKLRDGKLRPVRLQSAVECREVKCDADLHLKEISQREGRYVESYDTGFTVSLLWAISNTSPAQALEYVSDEAGQQIGYSPEGLTKAIPSSGGEDGAAVHAP